MREEGGRGWRRSRAGESGVSGVYRRLKQTVEKMRWGEGGDNSNGMCGAIDGHAGQKTNNSPKSRLTSPPPTENILI